MAEQLKGSVAPAQQAQQAHQAQQAQRSSWPAPSRRMSESRSNSTGADSLSALETVSA